jgi:hypothetical protein
MRICAITNVYNEAFNLPIWLSHYGAQVGIQNCIVVDHGSDDGSTDDLLGASRINIPRTTFNDHVRARLISGLANAMLQTYDAVIYTDCDEILVADPLKFANLVEFAGAMKGPCATAIGLNLVHNIAFEGAIEHGSGILKQRGYAHFVSPMCKTLMVRKSVTWGGGFHSCSLAPTFSDLFLFHLRWVDLGECLRRLTLTRNIGFSDNVAGTHHRVAYLDYLKNFQEIATRKISEDFDFSPYIEKLHPNMLVNDAGLYSAKVDIRSDPLFKVPERFSNVF